MRKIILIGGDLASGKSTFSNQLAKEFNLTLLSKDILKEIAGDLFYATNREENKKLSVLCFEYIKYFIEHSTCDLIIESNFKTYEMEEMKKYMSDNEFLSIRFEGDNEFLHDRFMNRLKGDRHYVHRSQDLSKLEDFVAVLDDLRQTKYIGKVINLYIDKNIDFMQNINLINEIKQFLTN